MDLTKKPNTIVNARLGTDTGYYYIDMSITPLVKIIATIILYCFNLIILYLLLYEDLKTHSSSPRS